MYEGVGFWYTLPCELELRLSPDLLLNALALEKKPSSLGAPGNP